MNFTTTVAWIVAFQLMAVSTWLVGYAVLRYKKDYSPGSILWFIASGVTHVYLWFQYFGQANREFFKQGLFSDLWVGITTEHQAAVASICIAIGYLFCVISGAVAVIIVMKTREDSILTASRRKTAFYSGV